MELGEGNAKHIQVKALLWFCQWDSFMAHKGQSLFKKLLVLNLSSVLWTWMFSYMLGFPNGNYFIQCVASCTSAAVHTTHINCDHELVRQPRQAELRFTEQPQGNQPLPVTRSSMSEARRSVTSTRQQLSEEVLPSARGCECVCDSGVCNVGNIAGLVSHFCCAHPTLLPPLEPLLLLSFRPACILLVIPS